MINRSGFRNLLESCDGNAREFGRRVSHLIGTTDARGRFHTDRNGNRTLKAPVDANGKPIDRMSIDEVSVRGLMETLLGESPNLRRVSQYLAQRELIESSEYETWTRSLLEDNGAGAVSASAFANINAFTGVVSGLLEVAILEAYQNPEFIGSQLAPVEASKQFEGRKTIGVSRLGNVAEERLPLMPTKRVQPGERWMTQPRTVEKALACEVSQEALFLDLTGGQLAEHAGAAGVGEWLGYAQELDIIDSFIGVNNSFNYKGTSYDTYISSGYYDNAIASGNELLHDSNVENVLIKFRDMTDPDTSTRILIRPNTVLVNREKIRTANSIFGNTAQQHRYTDATTSAHQANIADPAYKGLFRVIESPLVYERCVAATGLALSADASGKVWWMFESGPRTHVWVQNWPLRTQTAAPNQLDMIDRGVVMYAKADLRGVSMWKEPRRVVRSKA